MNEDAPIHDPVEPGPFQKYLFSGACYVQIGQCYGLVRHALERGFDDESGRELATKLEQVWRDYVFQQNTAIAAIVPPGHADPHNNPWGNTGELYTQVIQAGTVAMKELVQRLEQDDPADFGLEVFFSHWAAVCDRAYADMVRSEVFSRALADVVNTTFSTLGEHEESGDGTR